MEREGARKQELDGDDSAAGEWRDRVHDLKNPLSAILANCQYLMVHGELSGENAEVVSDIATSARALRDMLDGRLQNTTGGKSAAGRAKK
ncbi:MAG TPA: histidine kinase dimerization/phospho-acceptor domain-containing protein [Kofleriaceae bacterium]|jgi:K+-sensing histidine kinase KdpD